MKQHPLPLLHADGLAEAQGLAVNGEALVPDFPAVGLLVFARWRLGRAGILVLFFLFLRGEERLPFMRGEENLLIVGAWVRPWLDVDEGELAGVCSAAQIGSRHYMRVNESGARWLRRQPISQMAVGGNYQALFLQRAVHVRGNDLPVPVHQLWRIGLVEDIHDRRHAFMQANQRTRNLPVIAEGADGVVV